jgi:hypothetical protein
MHPGKGAVTKQHRLVTGLDSGLRRCVAGLVFADFAPKRMDTGPTTPQHIPEVVIFIHKKFA